MAAILDAKGAPGMDARSVAAAAEVQVGTLNSWVQRGLIPGMATGARGRLRDFDLETAINVALIVELVRRGLSAPTASAIVRDRDPAPRLLLMFDLFPGLTHPEMASLRDHYRRAPAPIGFQSEAQLQGYFEQHGGAPSVYMVINTELITNRMREAYDRWARERAG
jgi:hypothetical protein